jgi:hypothetical protein
MSLKNPVITPGIDPRTGGVVEQSHNHYATPGPHDVLNAIKTYDLGSLIIFSVSNYLECVKLIYFNGLKLTTWWSKHVAV